MAALSMAVQGLEKLAEAVGKIREDLEYVREVSAKLEETLERESEGGEEE